MAELTPRQRDRIEAAADCLISVLRSANEALQRGDGAAAERCRQLAANWARLAFQIATSPGDPAEPTPCPPDLVRGLADALETCIAYIEETDPEPLPGTYWYKPRAEGRDALARVKGYL